MSVSLVLSFEVIRFVTLFVCISLFIDHPIIFFAVTHSLSYRPPYRGGVGG